MLNIPVHAGPEALRRFRIRKGWKMASKRHNKVTRIGWRYEVLCTAHNGRKQHDVLTLSRRNDKVVKDFYLSIPTVKSVEIRSLSECLYAMDPEDYYSGSEIISMRSVNIDGLQI